MKKTVELGHVYVTQGIDELQTSDLSFAKFVAKCLIRHQSGDWGDLCKEDKELNEYALESGEDRLFSKYEYNGTISIYIITEWDRSATTILFPEEY